MGVIRVFPRRTSFTPNDPYVFIGDPPMMRPEADEVHISVTFTWDVVEGWRLRGSWAQYYPTVKIGGPAIPGAFVGDFRPGMYVKPGVTFTSRGCNRRCPWCLVPEREGRLLLLDIQPGSIISDNNLLQAGRDHISTVFDMLRCQGKAATFSGGLDARLVDDWVANELRTVPIREVYLAADTKASLSALRCAVGKLGSFLKRRQLRCYVLIGFDGETIAGATERLEAVWETGCLPFAQLYQPPEGRIEYSHDWRALQREWDRPAAMFAQHREVTCAS